ncbi:MAG: head-tail connector protein [Robiginitomaculum sp.]
MVTLDDAKLHCRVEHPDDDVSIVTYIGAATEWLGKIGVDVATDPLPLPIKQAILLIVALYYDNREAIPEIRRTTPLPFGVEALIAPYREHCV